MAGLFGQFNYNKPGPGIEKDMPSKKRFFLFFDILFRKIGLFLKANLLFLAACIPAILFWALGLITNLAMFFLFLLLSALTVGPALCALTYVVRCFSKEEHTFIWSDFKDAFIQNYWQAVTVTVAYELISYALYISYQIYNHYSQTGAMHFFAGMVLFLALIAAFTIFYTYLMMVSVRIGTFSLFKNAILFAFLGIKGNVIALFFIAVSAFLVYLFYPVSLLFFFMLPVLITYISVFNVYPTVKKYLIDPSYEKMKQEGTLKEKEIEPVFHDTTK